MSNRIAPMRMTGLASNLDVDSIVSKLMESYQTKKDKMKQDETSMEWKRDAYRAITTSTTTFGDTYFDITKTSDYMLSPNAYADYSGVSDDNTNTTSDVTRDTGVSAKGHEGAVEGKYNIVVNKVATNATNRDVLKGQTITYNGKNYSLDSAGSAVAANGGNDTLKVVFNGQTHDFKLGNMSVNDALKNIASNFNLNITSSSVDGQYHISANNSKSGKIFECSETQKVTPGVAADTTANVDVSVGVDGVGNNGIQGSLGAVGDFFSNIFGASSTSTSTGNITATNDNNVATTLTGVKGIYMIDGHNANVTITEPNGSKGSVESMTNDFLVDGVEYDISKIKLNGGTTTTNTTTTIMTQAPTTRTDSGVEITESKYKITNSDGSTTSKDINEFVNPSNTNFKRTITILTNPDGTSTQTQVDATTDPSDGSVTKVTTTIAADGTQTQVTSKTINEASSDPSVTKTLTADSNGNKIQTVVTTSGSTVTTVTTTTAKDGTVTTSTDTATTNGDNSVTNVNKTTTSFTSHTANITMSLNTDNIYKKITGFLDKYNALAKQINDAINEKKNYSYKPLTDTQKKSMTDDQIKQWETVAKSGILANDSNLQSMLNSFREAFYTAVDGSGFTLTDLGIHSYSGAGDAISKAGQMTYDPDKLKDAIKKYGSSLYNMFAGISKDQQTYIPNNETDLTESQINANFANRKTRFSQEGIFQRLCDIVKDYTRINAAPAGTLIQLAGSADSTDTTSDLYKQIKKKNDAIEDYDNYMADKEEEYYQKYSKLESYLAQAQTQQQAISSQLSKL